MLQDKKRELDSDFWTYELKLPTFLEKSLNLSENYRKFVRRLLRVTTTNTLNELKAKEITNKHWSALSGKYHGMPWTKLRKFWLEWLYPRLFSEEPIDRNKILEYLVKE